MRRRVAVVGGGLSGLSVAYRLQQRGAHVRLFESSERLGGKIRSERRGGYLFEHGPNGFLSSREGILRLSMELGLEAELSPARSEAKRRYLFNEGALTPLPTSPPALLKSALLGRRARLRLFAEPLISSTSQKNRGESVLDFATRRIGAEAAQLFIDPFVTGVHAGDPAALSVDAAFPSLPAWERTYGGLIRGAVRGARQRKTRGVARPKLYSFKEGMGALIDALARRCFEEGDGTLSLSAPVERICTLQAGTSRWRVESAAGTWEGDDLILACEAPAAAQILARSGLHSVSEPLSEFDYAPVVVAIFTFPKASFPHPLDGFGLLATARSELELLGVLWSSSIFEARAPAGQIMLRIIFGGARRPALLDRGDEELESRLLATLQRALGGDLPAPTSAQIIRWPVGIPQYCLGHRERLADAERALHAHPGLWLAGNGYYGVGLADCVRRADALAERIPGQIRGAEFYSALRR
ncbi:MAG: protoporphyrinogen oxidase [Myxococcota bacterium]|nr:protoporphyrinogen oxidase [Myxococcota bacterium]